MNYPIHKDIPDITAAMLKKLSVLEEGECFIVSLTKDQVLISKVVKTPEGDFNQPELGKA